MVEAWKAIREECECECGAIPAGRVFKVDEWSGEGEEGVRQ